MIANWLKDRLLNAGRFYRHENFGIYLAAQVVICLAVVHFRLQRGSPPAPILLMGLLLFSILLWNTPTGKPWHVHLYLAVQCLLAYLIFAHDIIFAYLFLVLTGQAMLLLKTRTGLIWVGILVLLTLLGNSSLYSEEFMSHPSRAVMVSVGFILTGILSSGIAQARRDRSKIDYLLAQIDEAQSRLQTYTDQSEFLAESEKHSRLSRKLHRSLGQRLTVAIVQVEGATLLIEREPHRVAGILKTVQDQLTEGLNDLRRTPV